MLRPKNCWFVDASFFLSACGNCFRFFGRCRSRGIPTCLTKHLFRIHEKKQGSMIDVLLRQNEKRVTPTGKIPQVDFYCHLNLVALKCHLIRLGSLGFSTQGMSQKSVRCYQHTKKKLLSHEKDQQKSHEN